MKTPYGLFLKMARPITGLTIDEVAELAGITAEGVQRIEEGKKCTPHELKALQGVYEARGLEFDNLGVRVTDVPKFMELNKKKKD